MPWSVRRSNPCLKMALLCHFRTKMGRHGTRLVRSLSTVTRNATKIPKSASDNVENYLNYHSLLSSCKALNILFQLHAHLVVSGHQNDHPTNTDLVKSYLSFENCDFASLVFHSLPNPSVRLYNSMIRTYSRTGIHEEAIKLYHCMLNKGLEPDKYTFTFVLKACTGALDIKEGVSIHRDIVLRGLEGDTFIGTALVDMHCKMGDSELAREAFDKMPNKDLVAWNAMIRGLSQSENPDEALSFTKEMQWRSMQPNLVTILNLVPAVSKLGDIDSCKSIHGYVIRKGFDTIVSNGLIDMYAKCGNLDVACLVFERMEERDDNSWGTMMAGYANNGCLLEILDMFDYMKMEKIKLNKVSVVNALIAAAELRDLSRGKEIHNCAGQQGIDLDVSVSTCIITMYAKCEDLGKAKQLFQGLKEWDLVAWSAVIAAFAQSGYPEEALLQFRGMQNKWLRANKVALVSVLSACAELSWLRLAKSVHGYAIKANTDSDISIATALVSMYAKCRFFTSALIIFNRMTCKDIVTWNALINAYAQTGAAYSAIMMFLKLQVSDIQPDSGTMVGLLPACALLNDLEQGSCIHGQIIKWGFESEAHVKNTLIDMYAKCGCLSLAEFLFNDIDFTKDEISWNVMISGYMYSGQAKEAISAFWQMRLADFQPNLVTILSVLPAAAFLSALQIGMTLHAYTIQIGFQSNTLVGNSLVDMYAKCGQLICSENIFYEIKKDIVSWNVMLAGYAIHGQGNRAVDLFWLMQESDVKADSLSFIHVLSACRHTGLIDEGRRVFDFMRKKHQPEPDLDHYACMVDLLGRSGLFHEILSLIKEMPMEPDAGVWGALLGACTMHSNVQLAEFALDNLVKLEPKNPTHYAVLSSIYANSGRWGDAGSTRSRIIKTGLRKSPGCSWV